MKLYLDFEPCNECKEMMSELSSPEMLFADEKTRSDESAKSISGLLNSFIISLHSLQGSKSR
jgi:cytidine deaminase